MSASPQSNDNPLGLNLDFMFGRGFLWSERREVADWVAIESLRMEIPDLEFPFDARGGLDRFQHTRCLVRELEVAISEVGLGELLVEAADDLEGFDDLQIRFLEDAAHVSFRLQSLGTETFVSFRAALVPPEPARADELHLSLYDYRAYGPLPYPARLVVHELLTGLLETPLLAAPGRGDSFSVGVAGDIVRFRPLKLLLLAVFPQAGWKLPNLSGVVLEDARIQPGVLAIRAVDETPDSGGAPGAETGDGSPHQLGATSEGARSLAAYEAKELFAHADRALFDGDVEQALSLLSNYRDAYGLHPELVARLLDCLVARATAANLAEAESIRRQLLDEDPDDLQAALVAPTIALARRNDDEALEAFEDLADRLADRDQTRDWMLCQLAISDFLVDDRPEEAAERLREVLKRDPQHRPALERLRDIYERIDRRAGLEETLKRLTGVYSDRDRLKETYLELARHLMDRQGDLAEARMYLEKVLRLDDDHLEALRTLGESYVLGDEPLRALKAFGSAARTAEAEQRPHLAGHLFLRTGRLWNDEMDDPRQALLTFQRALTCFEADDAESPDRRRQALGRAARMAEKLERDEEAIDYWSDALRLLQRRDPVESEDSERMDDRIVAHRHLGRLYDRRDRRSAAARHFREVLELQPGDGEALSWLDDHLRQGGKPDDLVELYERQLKEVDDEAGRLELVERLGDLYADLELPDQATEQYRKALEADPGREGVRQRLVELLTEHERFETLRRILGEIRRDCRDRAIRFELASEAGAAAEKAGDLEGAVHSYVEAAQLRAGDREALEDSCRVLRRFVDRHGDRAEPPVGSSTAGAVLEKMLSRLAEVVPSAAREREVLLEIAERAEERGDSAAASEARKRADALESPAETGELDDVDERLDSMLENIADGEDDGGPDRSPDSDESLPQPDFGGRAGDSDRKSGEPDESDGADSPVELPEPGGDAEWDDPRQKAESTQIRVPRPGEDSELPRPDAPRARSPESGADDVDEDENVESFRRRFASLKRSPSELPAPEEIEDKSTVDSGPTEDREQPEDPPETVRMSLEDVETLREESSDPRLAEQTDPDEPAGADSDSEQPGWSLSFSESPPDGDDQPDTSPDIDPVQMARDAVREARAEDDPRKLAESLQHLLSLADGGQDEMLDDDDRARLSRELGELLYYELDDELAARPHLERVRRLEPDGRGGDPEVLNALETIYERQGDVEARIRLLEDRLEAADSEEMKTTYRLLVARTRWTKQEDARGARRRLEEVLETDPDHEAAHRLLADIARDQGHLEEAARHLETVVEVAAEGLETVETRRRLADLLLEDLGDPDRARDHYERVLEVSPGDAQALEGVKEARAAAGDWLGYIEGLGRELGLLLGEPEGLSPEEIVELEVEDVDEQLQVPASRIGADAAHIAEDQLEDPEMARRLWGVAIRLWPQHAEALERRIALDRQCGAEEALAGDLESYAELVLDDRERFDALAEAAEIRARRLDEPDRARRLFDEAISAGESCEEPPAKLEEIRRARADLEE